MRILRSISTIALLAAACAFGGCSSGQGTDQQANTGKGHHESDKLGGKNNGASCIVTQFELRSEMRRLWTDHVAFTRFYIVEAIAGLPEAQFTAERLLQTQDQLGAALKPFYGPEAGLQLSQLLREQITGAVTVLKAAKSGDTAALGAAKDAWYANADAIAKFLSDANPNLAYADIDAMMRVHLDQLFAEASARLGGNWSGDVVAFDAAVNHVLEMADTLTVAITKQFPNLVSTKDNAICCDKTPLAREDLRIAMRKLVEDQAIWTRVVLIDSFGVCTTSLADLQVAVTRSMQNQIDIGNVIRPFYGDAVGNQLIVLLQEHVTDAVALIDAAKLGDAKALEDAKAKLYANADAIASFIVSANSNLQLGEVKSMMHVQVDQLIAEVVDHMNANYPADIADYDASVSHLLNFADALSSAIAKSFPR